ncbi:uncharacterized protein CMU_013140 [Cryptosporidium muris RN66]|uniref:Inhibitor of growth protein N-terminal histone-binding domain-containing protein n=1 Tax=Cryptosporidium muris (strain RN66) TaxID=441375 RepID=B6AEM2_CRYMR|nr:uncharacterized protein CMU_013140 [Cryptosporidium muris RN66]EEA06639.1 hypothetical protein, conserved [Cryptosporidium muris RN66]|eukprot:XP_002140988.1 hypothetical protein [Cryptosporidium muris RN66]
MSESLEQFMEDISLLSGWILRNLSLMREVDKKSNDLGKKLEEKCKIYLETTIQPEASGDTPCSNENDDPRLLEILEMQREQKRLLKEKIAISDQSLHFIRHDGEILKRHYELLRETLTEDLINNDNDSIVTNNSGRLSAPSGSMFKNTSNKHNNTVSSLSGSNLVKRDSSMLSGNNSAFGNSTWSSSRVQSTDIHLNPYSTSPGNINDISNKASRKRRASTPVLNSYLGTCDTTNNNTIQLELQDTSQNEKEEQDLVTSKEQLNTNVLCTICGGPEILNCNNLITACSSCNCLIHTTCCWSLKPLLCRKCYKANSMNPSNDGTYNILGISSSIEDTISAINGNSRSENIKTVKNSRKKQ